MVTLPAASNFSLFQSHPSDAIERGSAHGADSPHRFAAIFHRNFVGVQHLSLLLAFYTVRHDRLDMRCTADKRAIPLLWCQITGLFFQGRRGHDAIPVTL